MTSLRSAISLRRRALQPLALGSTLALALACSSNLEHAQTPPSTATPATSQNFALFDPSAGVIPLPNILATATVTGVAYTPPANPAAPDPSKVYVFPGVPPTSYVNGVPKPSPKDAMAYMNITELNNQNAVSGLTSPIKLSFQMPILQSSVTPATVKVFQILPDADGTETGKLGFRDVSALFTAEFGFTWYDRNTDGSLKPTTVPLTNPAGVAGAAVQLSPRLPLQPGSRYVYVVTDGVKDLATGGTVGNSLTFGFLRYVKPGGTSANTSLADMNDPNNPARLVGQASATSLESIRANVPGPGGSVLLSGYGKTMDDLVSSGAADASGKPGAGATTITNRDKIMLMGRFITTGAVATRILANTAATQIPVEGALWAWANNAPGTPFAGAPARQWSNAVSGFSTLGSSTVPGTGPGSIAYVYSQAGIPAAVPNAAVGLIAKGTFESADLNIDPAVANAMGAKPPSGNITGTPGAYNPGYYPSGANPVPGTGVLQGVRPDGNTLTGYLHVDRAVPFWFIAPATPPPAEGYPVVIYQHGITSQKESILLAANTICGAGYAILAIDAPLHGEMANGRASAEWGANFMSLLNILNTRTNFQQGAFNLWRLEKVAKNASLQNTVTAFGKPIAAAGATKFLGMSLGTLIGSYFMAGNSNQYGLPGASNIPAYFASPGARAAWVIRDGQAGFAYQANATLRAGGVAPGSHDYDQFLLLVQALMDNVDPAWALSPIGANANGTPKPSRLSGRVVSHEAIGDTTIPNSNGRYFGNALGGWGVLGGAPFDIAPGYTQVMNVGATSPTVPFMLGATGLKAPVAPAPNPPISGPTEGYFQFGTVASPASHTILLDFANPAATAAAQKQLFMWLKFGRVIDPADPAFATIQNLGAVEAPLKVPFLDDLK
jgi:hypothetical protein